MGYRIQIKIEDHDETVFHQAIRCDDDEAMSLGGLKAIFEMAADYIDPLRNSPINDPPRT